MTSELTESLLHPGRVALGGRQDARQPWMDP